MSFFICDKLSSTKLIKFYNNFKDACYNADLIILLTEWDEFRNYDWEKIYALMNKPALVFDGRNILDKEKLEKIGFIYNGLGK